jgi:hypothetical protein
MRALIGLRMDAGSGSLGTRAFTSIGIFSSSSGIADLGNVAVLMNCQAAC